MRLDQPAALAHVLLRERVQVHEGTLLDLLHAIIALFEPHLMRGAEPALADLVECRSRSEGDGKRFFHFLQIAICVSSRVKLKDTTKMAAARDGLSRS